MPLEVGKRPERLSHRIRAWQAARACQGRARATRETEWRDRNIAEVRKLISNEEFGEALIKIQALLQANPADVVVRNLETVATDGVHEQEKLERIKQGVKEIRSLVEAKEYREA